jgi:hypothetical protein
VRRVRKFVRDCCVVVVCGVRVCPSYPISENFGILTHVPVPTNCLGSCKIQHSLLVALASVCFVRFIRYPRIATCTCTNHRTRINWPCLGPWMLLSMTWLAISGVARSPRYAAPSAVLTTLWSPSRSWSSNISSPPSKTFCRCTICMQLSARGGIRVIVYVV